MSYNGLNTIKMWNDRKNRYENRSTFVLRDGSHAIIHIPVAKLMQVDKKQLLEIEQKGGEMLTQMRDTTLPNGINALVLYDNLIEVYQKPKEKKETDIEEKSTEVTSLPEGSMESSASYDTSSEQEKPKKKRGRPPKNQTSQ